MTSWYDFALGLFIGLVMGLIGYFSVKKLAWDEIREKYDAATTMFDHARKLFEKARAEVDQCRSLTRKESDGKTI